MEPTENKPAGAPSALNEGLAAGSCEVTPHDICTMKRFGDEPMQRTFSRLLKDKGVPMVGVIFLKLDPRYVLERRQNFETGGDVFRWWPEAANASLSGAPEE